MPSIAALSKETRRSIKKATRFCVMVAGQAGLGKTTLLTTLFHPYLLPTQLKPSKSDGPLGFEPTMQITPFQFEVEPEQGVPLIVEAIDTPGYSDEMAPEEQAKSILHYLENSFDEVFEEEQRIHRNPKFEEHRVHVLLYLLEPTALGLKEFDEKYLCCIMNRVNIIPVLAKADAYTVEERRFIKKRIMSDLERKGIRIFELVEDVAASVEELQSIGWRAALPFAAIGADFPIMEGQQRARKYPWCSYNVDDLNVCDVDLLQKILLIHARDELKETTEDRLYEAYRTEKLTKATAKVAGFSSNSNSNSQKRSAGELALS